MKDFDQWNQNKKNLEDIKSHTALFFKPGEIWWSALGLNIGREQDGKHDNFERPIVILQVFSQDALIILPLTKSKRTGKFYYELEHNSEISSVILSQVRLISSKRLLRKIYSLPEADFLSIKDAFKKLI